MGYRTAHNNGGPFSYMGGQWGYYTDAQDGLTLCTHRYYDPATGRWLTRDPIGYNGGVNLYGYCGNDPVGLADAGGYYPLALPPPASLGPVPGVNLTWHPLPFPLLPILNVGGQVGPAPPPIPGVTATQTPGLTGTTSTIGVESHVIMNIG